MSLGVCCLLVPPPTHIVTIVTDTHFHCPAYTHSEGVAITPAQIHIRWQRDTCQTVSWLWIISETDTVPLPTVPYVSLLILSHTQQLTHTHPTHTHNTCVWLSALDLQWIFVELWNHSNKTLNKLCSRKGIINKKLLSLVNGKIINT